MQSRIAHAVMLAMAAFTLAPTSLQAAPVVTSIAPGSEDAAIVGMLIENFEDVQLVGGLTIVLSVWRNSSNVITTNGPVTFAGTLPQTWTASSSGFPANPWDGTRALVNGWGHTWAFPFASSVEFQFSPPRDAVGFGLSNFQSDVTQHTLLVNGIAQGVVESLPGWVSTAAGKNRYVLISGEPIASVAFLADTHYDGLVFDKIAVGQGVVSVEASTWGRLKALYR